ncbi:MAG: excinuclease ABC subunit C [Novosphingobium sp.]|nr:excinuclease ABC subunit C [Novosphingobium sp.]MBX9643118.1 GIY-YIG nuclease family protein [Novosphingobium sp.]
MKGGFIYIMTNRAHGVLYVGVTADLAARIHQHKTGLGSKFCRRYGLDRLVLVEEYPSIEEAIVREKRLKKWERAWKIELIEAFNPEWEDLSKFHL